MSKSHDDASTVTLQRSLESLHDRIAEAGSLTRKKVLPGARGPIMRALADADQIISAVRVLVQRAGVGERLGFVRTKDGLQPAGAPLEQPPACVPFNYPAEDFKPDPGVISVSINGVEPDPNDVQVSK